MLIGVQWVRQPIETPLARRSEPGVELEPDLVLMRSRAFRLMRWTLPTLHRRRSQDGIG